jgi:hypothetical protein
MGYTTDFSGSLQLSRPLTDEEKKFINRISATRRMKRDVNKLMELYQGKHGNPFAKDKTPLGIYGRDGEYFAYDDGNCGQSDDASVIDMNMAPGQRDFLGKSKAQPGLWCQWVINEEGTELEWDGGEKFYAYIEWLDYYIDHFFSKWGVLLNGEITWEGEDSSDLGIIIVKDNVVTTKNGKVVYN